MELIKEFISKTFKINIISKNDKKRLGCLNPYSQLSSNGTTSQIKKNLQQNNKSPFEDNKSLEIELNIRNELEANNQCSSKIINQYPTNLDLTDDDEAKMTFSELSNYLGYEVEEHSLETDDGYILTIFKVLPPEEVINKILKEIIRKKQTNVLNKKHPYDGIINPNDYICFFQHGLLDSSDGWVCNLRSKCLPYIMANKGFEVWVANSRGNKYCKSHHNLDPLNEIEKEKFFDYSFDEMGRFDIPACLKYILHLKTKDQEIISDYQNSNNISVLSGDNQIDSSNNLDDASTIVNNKGRELEKILEDFPKPKKRIFYFGHSQGGASIVSSLTYNIEFFKQILKGVILLAPACRIANMNSSLIHLMKKLNIDKMIEEKKIYEILPFSRDLQSFSIFINSVCPSMSLSLLEEISDEECLVNCPGRLKVFMSHYPSGSSLRSILHFRQMLETQKFQSYDFGSVLNSVKYEKNKGEVITYNIDNIRGIPIILCAGGKDKLVALSDIRWLRDELLKGRKQRKIFTNVDYMDDIFGGLNKTNRKVGEIKQRDSNKNTAYTANSHSVTNENSDNETQKDNQCGKENTNIIINNHNNSECDEGTTEKIEDEFDCPLFAYYEFDMMGHLSFLLNSDISWFDYILNDIYNLINNYN